MESLVEKARLVDGDDLTDDKCIPINILRRVEPKAPILR